MSRPEVPPAAFVASSGKGVIAAKYDAPAAAQCVTAYRASVSEAAMEDAIRDLVKIKGGRVFHLRDARRAPELEDLPDLIVLLPGTDKAGGLVALLELKSARRAVTPGQAEVAGLVASAGRVVGGIVRAIPRAGEISYDEMLELLEGA